MNKHVSEYITRTVLFKKNIYMLDVDYFRRKKKTRKNNHDLNYFNMYVEPYVYI